MPDEATTAAVEPEPTKNQTKPEANESEEGQEEAATSESAPEAVTRADFDDLRNEVRQMVELLSPTETTAGDVTNRQYTDEIYRQTVGTSPQTEAEDDPWSKRMSQIETTLERLTRVSEQSAQTSEYHRLLNEAREKFKAEGWDENEKDVLAFLRKNPNVETGEALEFVKFQKTKRSGGRRVLPPVTRTAMAQKARQAVSQPPSGGSVDATPAPKSLAEAAALALKEARAGK